MERDDKLHLTPRLVIGFLIITAGVIFTLDNLGIVDAGRFSDWWPLALIAIGAGQLVQARGTPRVISGTIWLVAGGWLLLDNLDIIRVSFWDFWPLILVAVGVYIVWQATVGRGAPRADVASQSTLRSLAIMGGVHRTVAAQDFRGGELTAIMGGCEIDLRNASIAGGEAVIDVFAFWGGIELKVPETWTVVGQVFPLMGGFQDLTRPPKGDSNQRLIIKGLVVMGGVEVKN